MTRAEGQAESGAGASGYVPKTSARVPFLVLGARPVLDPVARFVAAALRIEVRRVADRAADRGELAGAAGDRAGGLVLRALLGRIAPTGVVRDDRRAREDLVAIGHGDDVVREARTVQLGVVGVADRAHLLDRHAADLWRIGVEIAHQVEDAQLVARHVAHRQGVLRGVLRGGRRYGEG